MRDEDVNFIFPRRRAAAIMALDRAVGWAALATGIFALCVVALLLMDAVEVVAYAVEYDLLGLGEAAKTLVALAGIVAAFVVLWRLPRSVPRTLLALGAVPAARTVAWFAEGSIYTNTAEGFFWDVGRSLILAALLFPAAYLVVGTVALIGAVAAPDAYLGENA